MVIVISSITIMTTSSESLSYLIAMPLFSLWLIRSLMSLRNSCCVSILFFYLAFHNVDLSLNYKIEMWIFDFHILFSAKNFARIPQLEVSLKENSGLRNDFQRFIGSLMSSQSERLDQVEMNIMRG